VNCRALSIMILGLVLSAPVGATSLLVPMDAAQTDHLRAYGLAYWCLEEPRSYECEWLLNYRCGSFLLPDRPDVRQRAADLGVSWKRVDEAQRGQIYQLIERENMQRIHLATAPRIAVYIPPDAEPWDDACLLALTYAEISHTRIWDRELLTGKLADFDWLHLHHEDFTGAYGKFFSAFGGQPWYRQMVRSAEQMADDMGFPSVQAMRKACALHIARWVHDGGFLFAMCLAAESLDISLASQGLDVVPGLIDGTPIHADVNSRLDYTATLAFRNFAVITDPHNTSLSDIDVPPPGALVSQGESFSLFEFSAKQDPICSMLTQCHVGAVADFLGQTTAFRRSTLKPTAIILGDFPGQNKVKYIHGDYGDGTFTFLAGHDPEDYAHIVGEEATDLSLHKHSPGYRLILNNVLFPAAKIQERKT